MVESVSAHSVHPVAQQKHRAALTYNNEGKCVSMGGGGEWGFKYVIAGCGSIIRYGYDSPVAQQYDGTML